MVTVCYKKTPYPQTTKGYNLKHVIMILFLFIGTVYSSTTDTIDVEITMSEHVTIEQNSAGLLEISLLMKNLNLKTIKYLWYEIDAYNRVDDVLTPSPGYNNCKGTGPVMYNQTHLTGGCTSYYDSYVSEIKVRITRVEYLDGTINTNPTDYYTFNRDIQNKKYWKWSDKNRKEMIENVDAIAKKDIEDTKKFIEQYKKDEITRLSLFIGAALVISIIFWQ